MIVTACENLNDIEKAVEWCERARDWVESTSRIDRSDAINKFERRRIRLEAELAELRR